MNTANKATIYLQLRIEGLSKQILKDESNR